ncbi:Ig-like domain repeat protein [Salinibacterium sp. dk2585]|uniref:Ig-like domain-containing protein n=1 Tax=Salinibacterium sp. dk2585 TaxID=2603292 RepID=UPI0011C2485B|nr:Ig-like domain-containing protein [Salinibacterium sp. dk2585]QEE60256.1 Ig-like domain repeat protein [Salinibacterium sp. dk2585]
MKPRTRRTIALLTVAALALTGIGIQAPSPAHAAPAPQQIFEFDSPSGTDWIVPAGVTEVLVGLRGGRGGIVSNVLGGRGADFAVFIPVTEGDRLTVYAGKDAHGSGDERKGGAGFVNGGDGGKGSLAGANGGGGGGAAAVRLNGRIIAVAGGGGGAGGYTGNAGMSMTLAGLLSILGAIGGYAGEGDTSGKFTYVKGGEAGGSVAGSSDGRTITTYAPGSGEGAHPGAVGKNGLDDSTFPRYMKHGESSGSAASSTNGGGGGGGGGGWPASGSAGGSGRKFLSSSGGSGGGAGASWVIDYMAGVRIDRDAHRPEDMHDYFGPLANSGTVRIMIPMKSTTSVSAPSQVEAGDSIPLRVRTADTRTPNTPLDGWVDVYVDNKRVVWGGTGGDHTFTLPPLDPGTYQVRADFKPNVPQRDYKERSTYSSASTTVTVVAPTPPAPPGPSEVETTTTLDIVSTPTVYGDTLTVGAAVEPGGSVDLTGEQVTIEVNGATVGTSPLNSAGGGSFTATAPVTWAPQAGTHEVVARFAGVIDSDPGTTDALPSASAPVSFTVAQAPTTTMITSAPSSIRAFGQVDVIAEVTATPADVDGHAVLLADGSPLMYSPLDADGEVLFDDVVIPWGTEELTVAFLGDANGNFAMSTSAAHPLTVTAVDTITTLSVSSADVRADEPLTMTATVTNAMLGVDVDPRGMIEFVFDGEVVHSVPAGMDSDPDIDDGEARFELDADMLPVGAHGVTARFVPAPGFGASASAPTALEVRGITTALTATAPTAVGTTADPATLEVRAAVASGLTSRAAPGDPIGGHVEAYLGGNPAGDAFEIVNGAGTATFSGLPVGTHQVMLRFVPEAPTMLASTAIVTVTVTEAAGGPGGGGAADTESAPLPTTGSDPSGALLLALSLLVGAGVMFTAVRFRRAATTRGGIVEA